MAPDFEDDDDRYPESGALEIAGALGRIAASAVPVLGPAAVELLNLSVGPALERNRNEWLNDLARKVRRLQNEGFIKSEDLESPRFVAALVEANRAAVTITDEQKRKELRNAVLNIALDRGPSEDTQSLFIRVVAELTPTHMQILRLITMKPDDLCPSSADLGPGGARLGKFFAKYVPALADPEQPATEIFLRDLIDRGLMKAPPVSHSGEDPLARRSKDNFGLLPFGEKFLEFIMAPPELTDADEPR